MKIEFQKKSSALIVKIQGEMAGMQKIIPQYQSITEALQQMGGMKNAV